jgi:predicted transcriptional regulator of viral defense system
MTDTYTKVEVYLSMIATRHKTQSTPVQEATDLFRQHHGLLRTRTLLRAGVHPRTLYALRDAGDIELLSRGLYRLTKAKPLTHPDLVTVATRVPQAVVCLISALSYHELTTQVPHAVHIAIPRGAEPPRLDYPPVEVVRVSKPAFSAGIETHHLDGIPVRIYSAEKTLADCFKFRNRIGLDVCLEALKLYRERKKVRVDDLLRFARICRVERIMRPYLEATL